MIRIAFLEFFFRSDCCHKLFLVHRLIGGLKLLILGRDQVVRRVLVSIPRRVLRIGLISDWVNSGRVRRLHRRAQFLEVAGPGRLALDFFAVRAHVCVHLRAMMLCRLLSNSRILVQLDVLLFRSGSLRTTGLLGRVVLKPPVPHVHVHDGLAERAT